MRSQLAKAVGCQLTYVSQVLNGHIHFNVEQGIRVNRFLSHSSEEGHFFLLLIQFARAGDEDTRRYFRGQIEQELSRRLVLNNRLGLGNGLKPEDQVTYYSAWYYAAAHILVTIPEFRSRRALTQRLGLGPRKTGAVLEFLVRTGLLEERGDEYHPGSSQIHLGSDSALISRHHGNWRLQALRSLDRENEEDVHFSAVASLSKSDVTKLKSMVVKKIEELVAVVKDSKEEELCVFCVDFFRL